MNLNVNLKLYHFIIPFNYVFREIRKMRQRGLALWHCRFSHHSQVLISWWSTALSPSCICSLHTLHHHLPQSSSFDSFFLSFFFPPFLPPSLPSFFPSFFCFSFFFCFFFFHFLPFFFFVCFCNSYINCSKGRELKRDRVDPSAASLPNAHNTQGDVQFLGLPHRW